MAETTEIDSTDFLPLEKNLEALWSALDKAKSSLRAARQAAARIGRQRLFDRCEALYLTAAGFVRRLADNTVGIRLGAFAIVFTLIAGISYSTRSSVAMSVVDGVMLSIPLLSLLYLPNDLTAKSRLDELSQEVRQLDNSRRAAATEVAARKLQVQQLKANYKALQRQYEEQRLLASKAYRLQQMARSNWRELKGQEFEGFLQRVFIEHGYDVEMTPPKGDQGVDLIIASDGKKIAIQVKGGYLKGVNNNAVQEVVTGRKIYECHGMAVITNAFFTKGAREAAKPNQCALIDKNELSKVILGKVNIFELCFRWEKEGAVLSMSPIKPLHEFTKPSVSDA